MGDFNDDDNNKCKFCLVWSPCHTALNDIFLYNIPFNGDTHEITIRHDEYGKYKMNDQLINIRFDNAYISSSECVIYTINEILTDYKKGHLLKQLQSNYPFLCKFESNQIYYYVLLNYSDETLNSSTYSQNLEIINDKVIVLNVYTGEGRKELMDIRISKDSKIKKNERK